MSIRRLGPYVTALLGVAACGELAGESTNPLICPPGDSCAASLATPTGGLEGWWNFDEKTGTTASDQSGFGRDATLSGGATFGTVGKPPIDDDRSYLAITTTSSEVATVPASSAFDLVGDFSVMLWAKIVSGTNTQFIGVQGSGCGAVVWEIAQNGSDRLHFAGGSGQVVSFGSRLAANTWTHVGVTYASGLMHLYLDGVEVASGAYTPGAVSGLPLEMGHVGGCNGRAVALDEVLIYSRALTATEVATLGTLPPAPTNLVIASRSSVTMDLAWTAESGAEKHIVEKGTASGNQVFYTHSPAAPTFQADHLTPSTQYSWRVRTVKNGLVGAPSAEVIGTTDPGPTAPLGVTASLISSDRIQVTWSSVSSAVKYYVFESVGGGPFNFKGSVVSPGTSLVAVYLAPATTYAYQVQAEDAGQVVSPMSATTSATTP